MEKQVGVGNRASLEEIYNEFGREGLLEERELLTNAPLFEKHGGFDKYKKIPDLISKIFQSDDANLDIDNMDELFELLESSKQEGYSTSIELTKSEIELEDLEYLYERVTKIDLLLKTDLTRITPEVILKNHGEQGLKEGLAQLKNSPAFDKYGGYENYVRLNKLLEYILIIGFRSDNFLPARSLNDHNQKKVDELTILLRELDIFKEKAEGEFINDFIETINNDNDLNEVVVKAENLQTLLKENYGVSARIKNALEYVKSNIFQNPLAKNPTMKKFSEEQGGSNDIFEGVPF